MTYAEVIIVGGGPAGSSCAWKLRQAGIETVILDKQGFPRIKPCAGWITPRVVRNLQLETDTYPHSFVRLEKLHLHFSGRRFSLPTRQYSIRRYEFDHWLLVRAGVPVHRHAVKQIRKEEGSYVLDDAYRCTYLVGAGGTHCPVYRTIFSHVNPRRVDSQITAVEVEMKSDPENRGCHLWFSEKGLQGYSWYVPKGNGYLNVGVGGRSTALEARAETIRDHWDHLVRKLADLSFVNIDELQPSGHTYYLRHAIRTVQRDNAFIIGDAAGLATKDLGEGIGPAVESGIRAARAIINRTEYSVKSISKYSLSDLVFPWRPETSRHRDRMLEKPTPSSAAAGNFEKPMQATQARQLPAPHERFRLRSTQKHARCVGFYLWMRSRLLSALVPRRRLTDRGNVSCQIPLEMTAVPPSRIPLTGGIQKAGDTENVKRRDPGMRDAKQCAQCSNTLSRHRFNACFFSSKLVVLVQPCSLRSPRNLELRPETRERCNVATHIIPQSLAPSKTLTAGTRLFNGTPIVLNYINGKWVESRATSFLPVMNPSIGEQIASVPLSTARDVDDAVAAAEHAFSSWSATPIKERAQVFFRYKTLLEKNVDALSALVHEENGKTLSEASAEIEKAIEVTEFACSMPQLVPGEILEVSQGVECRIDRYPLGVVASITPFNFPSMVPHWTIPNALVLGNAMILKPSQQVPLSSLRIAELLKEAGLPDGIFNVVHGAQEAVEAICDHPAIQAVTFVGSTRVAKTVYVRATSRLKRALCLGGAKNHLIVLPDANEKMAASNIAVSMSGCAGQRCMAASVMVAVGEVDHIIKLLCEEAKKIIPGKNLGAVISSEAKERIERYITEAEQHGAKVLVDGRGAKVEGKEEGFYVGPTVLDYVRPEMEIAQEEVFGPVLSILRAKTADEALTIQNSSPYGNAASVFTQSGGMARYIIERASAGMIGVNIGVPVPREPFSFGGWNESKFGAGDITGKSSIEFFTKLKKTTTKWNPEARKNWMT